MMTQRKLIFPHKEQAVFICTQNILEQNKAHSDDDDNNGEMTSTGADVEEMYNSDDNNDRET